MSRLILVTGAAGAIGRNVTRLLAARGDRVIGLGHGEARGAPTVDWLNGAIDASNLSGLSMRWGVPDAIIHLAGGAAVGASLASPVEDFSRTVATSVRLLDWVRQYAATARVVLASSAAVYGTGYREPIDEECARSPFSPYGLHKAMMEMAGESWGKNFGVEVAIVRLFSVYGEHLRKQLIWEVSNRLLGGVREITLGGTGAEVRDWLHIEDAASILIAAINLAAPTAPIFNGCSGNGINVRTIVERLASACDMEISLSFTEEVRLGDPPYLVGCPARAFAAGLFPVIDLDVGLRRTSAWIGALRRNL